MMVFIKETPLLAGKGVSNLRLLPSLLVQIRLMLGVFTPLHFAIDKGHLEITKVTRYSVRGDQSPFNEASMFLALIARRYSRLRNATSMHKTSFNTLQCTELQL